MSASHELDSERAPLLLERISTWVVIGGAALGFAAAAVDRVAPKWVGNMAALWFLCGFLAGATNRSRGRGLRLGVLSLAPATVVYYATRMAVSPLFTVEDLAPIPAAWLVVGLISGAVSGWLGAYARAQPAAWGVPAGVFLGEAATVIVLRQRIGQAAVEVLLAAVCVWAGRPALPRVLLVAFGTLPYVAAFTVAYRVVLW